MHVMLIMVHHLATCYEIRLTIVIIVMIEHEHNELKAAIYVCNKKNHVKGSPLKFVED